MSEPLYDSNVPIFVFKIAELKSFVEDAEIKHHFLELDLIVLTTK